MPRVRAIPFTSLDEERASLDLQWETIRAMWASIAAEWHKIEAARTAQQQCIAARLNAVRPYGFPPREGGPHGDVPYTV